MFMWGFPKTGGPNTDPKQQGSCYKDTQDTNHPFYKNSPIVLIRISAKPALCQPRTPLKEPYKLDPHLLVAFWASKIKSHVMGLGRAGCALTTTEESEVA